MEVLVFPDALVGVTARVLPKLPEDVPHLMEIDVVASEFALTVPLSFAVVVPIFAEVGAAEVTVGAPFNVKLSVLPKFVP
jgi:hypothetical protein